MTTPSEIITSECEKITKDYRNGKVITTIKTSGNGKVINGKLIYEGKEDDSLKVQNDITVTDGSIVKMGDIDIKNNNDLPKSKIVIGHNINVSGNSKVKVGNIKINFTK